MKILVFLQNAELETIANLDELILAQNHIEGLQAGYLKRSLPVPEWIAERLDEINREINERIKGDVKRRLKLAKAKREGLKTTAEKRADADAEIAALERQLGN